MKKFIALTAVIAAALSLVVAPASASTPKHAVKAPAKAAKAVKTVKPVAPTTYECQLCHMQYSAVDAKKYKFIDPMDAGKLLPMKPAAKAAPAPSKMKM
ncbi:MAG TPA: hypothetical protein VGK19_26175 [Capsulimonadaceae bacterium]|jgi:hypothetical protein